MANSPQTASPFSKLSSDLKSLIIDHIIRPSDLVSLCLTNKELHELAVRNLYNTVTLDIGQEADRKLPAFINPRNIGLKYIRNVELYRAEVPDKCNQMQQADFAIRMIIEFLPENILEKFSWHPWASFSSDNLALLYKKQRKMKWLEAIQLDRALCSCLKKDLDLDSVVNENVTRLGLYPDNQASLDFCGELLKRTKKLEKITLHSNFEVDDPRPIPARELNDSVTGPGLITRTIFSHKMPFASCTPMTLTELTLQNVYLRYAAETYCKVIDFSTLRILRIFGCSGSDSLFAELCKSSKLPVRLETLEYRHKDDEKECEGLNVVEDFLCLVSGIEKLTIDIACTRSLPSVGCITRHAKTLKLLNAHAFAGDPSDSDEDEEVFDLDAFTKLCTACALLEQLSVAFPPTPIARAPSPDSAAFAAATATLPRLVTLNITTWPNNTPASARLGRKQYELLLAGIAEGFFAHCPRLNVVGWGTNDKIYERADDGKTSAIFVRAALSDPLGRARTAAVPVGWCLRRYAEPRSDVLDFALTRAGRPPTRGDPGGGAADDRQSTASTDSF